MTRVCLTQASGNYKAGGIYRTGSYKLSDLVDATSPDQKPYVDVIVFSTASNVAGADAGKEGALNGDIPLHFYVDNTAAYNDVVYDPQSTDPNHVAQCLDKFWSQTATGVSNFLLKGSDLAIETVVENSGGQDKNTGKYNENPITSNDPDQGLFTYHRAIQVSWKDDVTQENVTMGELFNGMSRIGTVVAEALLRNVGDIVLMPGRLVNYGTIYNARGANIYLAAATEAIIPIEPDPANPTVESKRITLDPPVASVFENHGTLINYGRIMPASVKINDNTSFGELTVPGDHTELFNFVNDGKVVNHGFIWGWGHKSQEHTSKLAAARLPRTGDGFARTAGSACVALLMGVGAVVSGLWMRIARRR